MRIKFTGKTMSKYAGSDGNGGALVLAAGESAEVSDVVGKLLLQRYGQNFEKSEAAPAVPTPEQAEDNTDKLYRKTTETKTK